MFGNAMRLSQQEREAGRSRRKAFQKHNCVFTGLNLRRRRRKHASGTSIMGGRLLAGLQVLGGYGQRWEGACNAGAAGTRRAAALATAGWMVAERAHGGAWWPGK